MVEKFKIAQHGKNDRNIKASVENIKQQTYVNNIENKTKINELIDEITSEDTKINDLQEGLNTLEGTVSGQQTEIDDLEDIASDLQETTEYSTSEKIVGKWINGELLYRKVINCGTLPNSTSKIISTGLGTSEVNLIKLEGLAVGISGGNSFLLTLPDISPSNPSFATRLSGNSENGIWRLIIETGVDRTNYSGYVSIYYTKN